MTASERRLEQYREYLQLLATLQLPLHLQAKVQPADVVQQTLVKAHQQLEHFRGQTAGQFAAWLRRLLAHTMTNHIDKVQVKLKLERRLVMKIDELAARLEAWLAGLATPSGEQPQRHERVLRLSDALGRLPSDQRHAVEWFYLKDCSITQIAELLGRTEAAAAGLVRRGLARLGELLAD